MYYNIKVPKGKGLGQNWGRFAAYLAEARVMDIDVASCY